MNKVTPLMKINLLLLISIIGLYCQELNAQDYFFTVESNYAQRINKGNQAEPDSSVYLQFNNGFYDPLYFYKNKYDGFNLIYRKTFSSNDGIVDSFKYDSDNRMISQAIYYGDDIVFLSENEFNDSGLLDHSIMYSDEGMGLITYVEDSSRYVYNNEGKLSKIYTYNYFYNSGSPLITRFEIFFSYNQGEYPISADFNIYSNDSNKFIKYSRFDNLIWDIEGNSRFFDKILSSFKQYLFRNNTYQLSGYDTCLVSNGKLMQREIIRNNALLLRRSFTYNNQDEIIGQVEEEMIGGQIDTSTENIYNFVYAPSGEKLSVETISKNHIWNNEFAQKYEYYYEGINIGLANEEFKNEINIYPNPVSNQLHFKIDVPINQIEITNLEGKIIKRIKTNEESIDVSDLSPGFYIIHFMGNEEIYQSKFVKQ